ncbi:NF045616 family extracytoplasmic (lipo)protein [Acinetobacter nosocomialis]|uniref:NF045616 family extracytoplasmic (lipo)protein n=1 Tax=Acinetobacter nosocomialis TaxID=106654 RepID=UPI0012505C90|nr:NF045616 family extracytoplasmic (lipo)protein [Acinetobacter nosocomialis]
MYKTKLSLALICTILMNVGCAQPISHELKAIVKNNDLCIYTDNKNTYLDPVNYFIVFVGEYKPTQKFESIYDKTYQGKGVKFPIKSEDCLSIPASVFEDKKVYDINLESNKNFSKLICISKKKNILSAKAVSPEDTTCN